MRGNAVKTSLRRASNGLETRRFKVNAVRNQEIPSSEGKRDGLRTVFQQPAKH